MTNARHKRRCENVSNWCEIRRK